MHLKKWEKVVRLNTGLTGIFYIAALNFSWFIARRLQLGSGSDFTRRITGIAVAAVAISAAVMMLALFVSGGYQKEIRNKITGFQAHIQLMQLDMNNSYERQPVDMNPKLENDLRHTASVVRFQRFAIKPGIIKTDDQFQGILLKGFDTSLNETYLQSSMLRGRLPHWGDTLTSHEIAISENIATKLHLSCDSTLTMYFIQDPPRVRQFTICGIYQTGLDELDDMYAFVDLRQIRRLNGWKANQINGYEVWGKGFESIPPLQSDLAEITPVNLEIRSVTDMYPALFDWLNLLDTNVFIIIALMLAVAAINMITALLILIIERSQMIGTFKLLGAPNRTILVLFTLLGSRIVVRGLIYGNILGLLLAWIQHATGIITLSQKDYFIRCVPIYFDWISLIYLNLFTIIICFLILLLPAAYVSRIRPAKVIRWD